MGDTVIYGAGNYAKELYNSFVFWNRTNEIEFFVVSHGDEIGNKIGDKYICSIEEKKDQLHDKNVIVAVSPKNSDDICEYLQTVDLKSVKRMSSEDYGHLKKASVDLYRSAKIEHRKVLIVLNSYDRLTEGGFEQIIDLVAEKCEVVLCIAEKKIKDDFCAEKIKQVEYGSDGYYRELATSGIIVANFQIGAFRRCEQSFLFADDLLLFIKDNNITMPEIDTFFFDHVCVMENQYEHKKTASLIEDIALNPEKYDKETSFEYYDHDIFYDMTQPKVSIIVPVYNTEKYLKRCLNSAVRQTLAEIEIICIDDGSSDGSVSILDEYAKKDRRVKVLHRKNKGYGSAVNVGIAEARGEYVAILESDDYIMRNMYERLYYSASKDNLDLIKAQCYFCWDSIDYRVFFDAQRMEEYFGVVLTEKDRDIFFGFLMNTWSGIYKKSFLVENGIIHNESPGAAYQDNGFWIQTLMLAKKAMWIKNPLYLYNQDNEKASTRNTGLVDAMINEYLWVEKKLEKKGISKKDLRKIHYYRLFRHKGNFFRIADEYKMQFCEQVISDYEEYGYALEDGNENIKKWYQQLIDNPKGYCVEVIERKKYIISLINKMSKIYIYEVTPKGTLVKRILHSIGEDGKLLAFLQRAPIYRNKIGNTPVYCIFDAAIDFNDSLVIVSTPENSEYYDGIITDITSLGCNEIITCDDILDYFYWII